MGNLDNDLLPTTAVKRLQTKRVLQEQHRDRPRADHPHDLELCLDQPAAPPKYARAPDGKKVVSPGHPSRVEQPKTMNRVPPSHMEKYEAGKEDTPPVASRCVTLVSERAIRSSSTSWPDKEEELVRCDPVVKTSSESNGQEVGTRTDTPPEPPVEHGDIHMKNLDDDNSPTPILSSSKTFSEQQGGSVSEEGRQTIQRQELNKDILGDVGGVSHSHHESESRRSTVKRTPKVEAEAPLGPNWVKARHPVADDPWRCLCDRQPQMYGDNRRKKPNAKFLGDVVHSMATPDRALLKFLFFRDWIQLTQANI
ncbi:hypothetical protein DFH29DRAFT_389496 [Suillus ampliporus]|nr:hypothetical protein DFH29DRAFT_389496 [Suillus ampliporus]